MQGRRVARERSKRYERVVKERGAGKESIKREGCKVGE